jgi:hypothetical protein
VYRKTNTTTYRCGPKRGFLGIPRNGQKTVKNTEIRSDAGLFRADICSGHREPPDRHWRAGVSRQAPWAGNTGAGKVLVDRLKEQGKETWPTREK